MIRVINRSERIHRLIRHVHHHSAESRVDHPATSADLLAVQRAHRALAAPSVLRAIRPSAQQAHIRQHHSLLTPRTPRALRAVHRLLPQALLVRLFVAPMLPLSPFLQLYEAMAQRIQRADVFRQRQQQLAARQHHRQEEIRLVRQIVHRVRHAQAIERQPKTLQTLLRRQTRLRVLQNRAKLGHRGEIQILAELFEVFGEDESGVRRVVRKSEQQQHYASNPHRKTTALPHVDNQHFLHRLHKLRSIPAGNPTPRCLSIATSSAWQPTVQLAYWVAWTASNRSSSCFRSPWISSNPGISAGRTSCLARRM